MIGRTIVGIEQERFYDTASRQTQVTLHSLTLDDGTRIHLLACEAEEHDPYVHAWVTKPPS